MSLRDNGGITYRYYTGTPLYPFGYGLSYTRFTYDFLYIHDNGYTIEFHLKNVGTLDGEEISQLYLSFPPEAGEPPKLLKNFRKTFLRAGTSASIAMTLSDRDFSIWNTTTNDWQFIRGTFIAYVGSSSAHLPLQAHINTNHWFDGAQQQ